MLKAEARKQYKERRGTFSVMERVRLDDLLLIQLQTVQLPFITFLLSYWPIVFLLYPLLSVATLNSSFKFLTKNSTIGDLPVPPTDRLPTHIRGNPNVAELIIFLSYNLFLTKIINQ